MTHNRTRSKRRGASRVNSHQQLQRLSSIAALCAIMAGGSNARSHRDVTALQQVSRGLCCFGSEWGTVADEGRVIAFESTRRLTGGVNRTDLFVSLSGEEPQSLTSRFNVGQSAEFRLRGRQPLSADGSVLVYSLLSPSTEPERPEYRDVYRLHVTSGQNRAVSIEGRSVLDYGDACMASVDRDGTRVAFIAEASATRDASGDQGAHLYLWTEEATEVIELAAIGSDFDCDGGGAADWAPIILTQSEEIVFVSSENGLIDGDENDERDVFIVDLESHSIEGVSTSHDGSATNGASDQPSASTNGNLIAFRSDATNIAQVSDLNASQIYLRFRDTEETKLISQRQGLAGSSDSVLPVVSGNGNAIVFSTKASNLYRTRWWERSGQSAIVIYEASTASVARAVVNRQQQMGNMLMRPGVVSRLAVTDDARLIVFDSDEQLGSDTEDRTDVWSFDRSIGLDDGPRLVPPAQGGDLRRISMTNEGAESHLNMNSMLPVISPGGEKVAFISEDNALDAKREDVLFDGMYVASIRSGSVTLLDEVYSDGHASIFHGAPAISEEGELVAYGSASQYAGGLVLRNPRDMTEVEICELNARASGELLCSWPDLSRDGSVLVFQSARAGLVPGDTDAFSDVFAYHRATGVLERVSGPRAGVASTGPSHSATVSADGRFVAFESASSMLVSGDTNDASDIFIADLEREELRRVSSSGSGEQGDGSSSMPRLSRDGRYVVFTSTASNLVDASPPRGDSGVYIRELDTDSIRLADSGLRALGIRVNSARPAVSPSGRFVVFVAELQQEGSQSPLPGQIYMTDRVSGDLLLVSQNRQGEPGNGSSNFATVGEFNDLPIVAFMSSASNLVDGDRNFASDVFVFAAHPQAFPSPPIGATMTPVATPWPTPTATLSSSSRFVPSARK